MKWPFLLCLLLPLGCGSPPLVDDDDTLAPLDDDDSGDDDDSAPSTWRSALYPEQWAPGMAGPSGGALHDFSYAGYGRSERPLPEAESWPTLEVTDYGADPTGGSDSGPAIQAAIDAAAAGDRVHLAAGTYRVDDLLRLSTSGVVIDGDGPESTRIWFTRSAGMSDRGHLSLIGSAAPEAERPLSADGAPFSTEVTVQDATGLAVGDEVQIGWVITDEYVAAHGMEAFWEVSNGQWRAFFRRQVVGVDPSSGRITLDVPLRGPALLRDGASLRRAPGVLREVGVQDLMVSTEADWTAAWAVDRSHALLLQGVVDGWVRNVASGSSSGEGEHHLMSGGLKILDSARITVADSALERAQNRGGGGNGYLYEVSRSNEVLIRDCVGRAGRHNFIQNWDFGTSGVVWLRTLSEEGFAMLDAGSNLGSVGASEFHHSLATANLIDDSVTHDAWKAVNRRTFSSGAGHTATDTVFWNLRGSGTVTSFQWELGYIIGTGPELAVVTDLSQGGLFAEASGTAPEDWAEGLGEGESLRPQSLFEDQLARRLSGGEERSRERGPSRRAPQ